MEILSLGAGMQSSALVLMSCENKKTPNKFPEVPVYDAVIFCDLGKEPPWVYSQLLFLKGKCEEYKIPFYILDTNLYSDYMDNFGKSRVTSVPFWTVDEDGKKGKMLRHCTLDYKIDVIQKFIKKELLGYKKFERIREDDIKKHGMHIGFSMEEQHRCKDNPHSMFINKYPLVEMKLERKDNYAYMMDVWGFETKASACNICPFHRNYFFKHLKENHPSDFNDVVMFDEMLETKQPLTKIKSKLYISRSRKRIKDLEAHECNDCETFIYNGKQVWNGF